MTVYWYDRQRRDSKKHSFSVQGEPLTDRTSFLNTDQHQLRWGANDQKRFDKMQEIALTSGRAYRGRRRLYVRKFPWSKVVFWSLLTLAICYVWWVAAMIFINWNWPPDTPA